MKEIILNKKIKGIIFDIDGTLTSTNQLIFDTFNHVAKKYSNTSYSDKEIISFFGPTEEVILKELFPAEYDAVVEDYYQYYQSNHVIATSFSGLNELLKELKENSIILSIYTGKGRRSTIITLTELGLIDYFDMIVTGDDVEEHKPSAEGIVKFLNKFNLKPDEILMIGDAPADIIASSKAGVECISVLWDSYSAEKVKLLNPKNLIYSVPELRSLIFKKVGLL